MLEPQLLIHDEIAPYAATIFANIRRTKRFQIRLTISCPLEQDGCDQLKKLLLDQHSLVALVIPHVPSHSVDGCQFIADAIAELKQDVELFLGWCAESEEENKTSTHELFKLTADGIAKSTRLKKLHCSRLLLNSISLRYLYCALKSNTSVTQLDFPTVYSGNFIAAELIELMTENKTISHMTFSSFTISPQHFSDASSAIEKCSLRSARVKFDRESSQTFCKAFFDGLKRNRTIEELQVDEIPGEFIWLLFDSLKTNTGVKILKLGKEIGSITEISAIKTFAEMLMTNKTLTEFISEDRYSSSDHSNLDISSIMEALKENTSLRTFWFWNWKLDLVERGLLDVLRANKTLNSVVIRNNTIISDNFTRLFEFLATNTLLKKVWIDTDCQKVPNRTVLVTNIVAKNRTLRSLTVNTHTSAQWEPSLKELAELKQALKQNDTLSRISLDIVVAVSNKKEYFSDVFETNRSLISVSFGEIKCAKFTRNNRMYQAQRRGDVAIVLHNIRRDPDLQARVPKELWMLIFKFLREPGTKSSKLATSILYRHL